MLAPRLIRTRLCVCVCGGSIAVHGPQKGWRHERAVGQFLAVGKRRGVLDIRDSPNSIWSLALPTTAVDNLAQTYPGLSTVGSTLYLTTLFVFGLDFESRFVLDEAPPGPSSPCHAHVEVKKKLESLYTPEQVTWLVGVEPPCMPCWLEVTSCSGRASLCDCSCRARAVLRSGSACYLERERERGCSDL